MTSLLPSPFGAGTRNNMDKRAYIFEHLPEIEYQTLTCPTKQDAVLAQRVLKNRKAEYLFKT
jgi:hypothetical protein